MNERVPAEKITSAIYRVVFQGEAIKAVATDLGLHPSTVTRYVRLYERRDPAPIAP